MTTNQEGEQTQIQLFLEHTAVVAWLKDASGHLVFASDNYLRRFGWTKEYAYGKTECQLWPQQEAQEYRQNDLKLLQQAGPLEVIEKATGADGVVSWWFGSKFLFTDAQGQQFFGGVAVDISACKQSELRLAESNQRYSQLLDSMPKGIVLTCFKNQTIVYTNPRFDHLFGYAAGELIGQPISKMNAPTDKSPQGVANSIIAALERDGVWRGEVACLRKDGSRFWSFTTVSNFNHPQYGRVWLSVSDDISERKQIESALRNSEARYIRAVNGSKDGIWEWNIQTNEEYLSPRWKFLLGYLDHELPSVRASFVDNIHPDDKDYVLHALNEHLQHRGPYEVEMRLRCKNGEYRWFHSRGNAEWDAFGQPLTLAGSISDITERKLVEHDLRIAAIAFESQEGMTVTDVNGIILRVNRAFSQITGYAPEEVIGKNPSFLRSGRHDDAFYQAMWKSINQTGAWEGEIWNRRKNGEIYPEYLIITAVRDNRGKITNYVATFNDITLSKAAADEIQNLAFYDPLTLLPNRRLLLDRLKQALAASTRNDSSGAILFIDLDHFKTINDTLGHNMGDLLLQQVAARLSACVRESDTVARLGGDEFVVMLERLSADTMEAGQQTETIAKKILAGLNQPYPLGNQEFRCGASIGATLFYGQDICQDELLKQADIAMYQAKTAGRNLICFFDPKMQTRIAARAALENELHKVLGQHELCLYYQVQVDHFGNPVGAEALLRWNHPIRGLIAPGHFIPVAEESGLILPIGQWVLETGCQQLGLWQQSELTSGLELAINVSARQFHQASFVAQVKDTLQRHAINPRRLKLELTESMLLDKTDSTIQTIQTLKNIGIQFSLDDFGTGYSSLQYLKRLPLDQLKIDQSFVHDLAENHSDQAIVQTIIAMAHSLNLDVIAEGVETEEQHDILISKGCMRFQGYLFGKPMPIGEFENLIGAMAGG